MNGGFAGVAGGWQGGGGGQTTPSGKGDQNPLSDRREEGEDPEPHTGTQKNIRHFASHQERWNNFVYVTCFFQMKNCAKRYFWRFSRLKMISGAKRENGPIPPLGVQTPPLNTLSGGGLTPGVKVNAISTIR